MRVFVRRWRSHTSYAVNKSRFRLFVLMFCLLLPVCLWVVWFETSVVPYVIAMAEDQAETVVVMLIDESVSECDELAGLEYSDLIRVSNNDNGEAVSVTANTVKLNKIRSGLSVNMNRKFDKFCETEIKIPLGGLAGFRILSGIGVSVPVRFTPFGTAYADFKSSVEGVGINRTYHKIYIEASATVSIFIPMHSEVLTVKTQVPIAETVISGEVPDTYLNIDGLVNNEGTN